MSTALLFDLDEVAPARAPAPPPPSAPVVRHRPARAQQMALDVRVHLPMHPDYHAATGGVCLVQQDECEAEECRRHLGAVRDLRGQRFGCALAVADAYPLGLPPCDVATLLGADEGVVQTAEHNAYRWLRQELARLEREEREDARRARIRRRLIELSRGR
jgi:hypothetical protein